jgi:methylthioribose-1-phosphate isomerase
VVEPHDIIRFDDDGTLRLLDQTRLPGEQVEYRCERVDDLIDAISRMVIRGAPALGVAGAYGVALAAHTGPTQPRALRAFVTAQSDRIAHARPTAVNLAWGVNQALALVDQPWQTSRELQGRLVAFARRLHDDQVTRCRRIGGHGAGLIADHATIITYCNTGALATAGYGSALGVIRAVAERGGAPHVIVCETRPLLQGARLTAWELADAAISHTLVTDNAVGALLRETRVDAVIVGADRIARNGDTANKIGTYTLAVVAHHHGVAFYVAAPSSTIDTACWTGDQIRIEQRDPREVTIVNGAMVAPAATSARNDAFDVTPAALVTAIITEHGVHHGPYRFVGADA